MGHIPKCIILNNKVLLSKTLSPCQVQWLVPVIPATVEAYIGRILLIRPVSVSKLSMAVHAYDPPTTPEPIGSGIAEPNTLQNCETLPKK
jgi:hypothetical protein